MFKQCQIRPRPKSKSPSSLIRSPAFQKKSQDGVLVVNGKNVNAHRFYHRKNKERPIENQLSLQFWGLVHGSPDGRRDRERRVKTCSSSKRQSYTPSKTILNQYMSRKPNTENVRRRLKIGEQKLNETVQANVLSFYSFPNLIRQKCQSKKKTKRTVSTNTHSSEEVSDFSHQLLCKLNEYEIENCQQNLQRYSNIKSRLNRKSECGYYSGGGCF